MSLQLPSKVWLKRFAHLAWPVSLQSVLISLLGFVDVFMVAQLGEMEVAAVGFASRAVFVVIVIMNAFAVACAILSSQYWGLKDWGRIGRTVFISAQTGAIFAIIATLFICIYPASIIGLATEQVAVIQLGSDYLVSISLVLILTLPIMIFESALRASGNTRLPLYVSTLAIFLNILFNQILIFGWGIIPALGVVGAGIASVMARFIHLSVLLLSLKLQRHPLLAACSKAQSLIKKRDYQHYLELANPLICNFAIWSGGVFLLSALYGQLGTEALAIVSILGPIEGLTTSLFMGFAAASSILIGNKLGVDAFDEAWIDAKNALFITPLVGISMGLILAVISPWVLTLFSQLPTATLEQAQQVIFIVCASICLKTWNNVLINGILRSGGENRFCLFSDILCQWCVGITLTAIAIYAFDFTLFWALLVTQSEEIVKASLCFWRMQKRYWLKNLTSAQ